MKNLNLQKRLIFENKNSKKFLMIFDFVLNKGLSFNLSFKTDRKISEHIS